MLSEDQTASFRERGFVVAPSGLVPDAIEALHVELEHWIEEPVL